MSQIRSVASGGEVALQGKGKGEAKGGRASKVGLELTCTATTTPAGGIKRTGVRLAPRARRFERRGTRICDGCIVAWGPLMDDKDGSRSLEEGDKEGRGCCCCYCCDQGVTRVAASWARRWARSRGARVRSVRSIPRWRGRRESQSSEEMKRSFERVGWRETDVVLRGAMIGGAGSWWR